MSHQNRLRRDRKPGPVNGLAKRLFASDLLAVAQGKLALEHEQTEKELLAIGERLGLRGAAISKLNETALQERAEEVAEAALAELEPMTLSVIDGDFPRELLAEQNLRFANYEMPAGINDYDHYDPKTNKPGIRRQGTVILSRLDQKPSAHWQQVEWTPPASISLAGFAGTLLMVLFVIFARQRRRGT